MPDTIEEKLKKLRAQQSGQSIEERLAALRAQQPQPAPGFLENLSVGGERFLRGGGDTAQTAYEIGSGIVHGALRPLGRTAEPAGRALAGPADGGEACY